MCKERTPRARGDSEQGRQEYRWWKHCRNIYQREASYKDTGFRLKDVRPLGKEKPLYRKIRGVLRFEH
jgi:hypothetical protein